MSHSPQGNKADLTTLETRLSAARAGYLENINNATLKTLAPMRGTDNAALASSWTAALATILGNFSAARIGYMDAIARDRPSMIFPSVLTPIIVVPGTGADLNFPSVVVDTLPDGIAIAKADYVLVIGGLFDTSGAENQIKTGTTDQIFVKKSTDAWDEDLGEEVLAALEFAPLSLQVDADAYRGGPLLFGAIDIKAVVTGNATYNFRSDETVRTKGVEATGATLELLDVTSIIRVWFN